MSRDAVVSAVSAVASLSGVSAAAVVLAVMVELVGEGFWCLVMLAAKYSSNSLGLGLVLISFNHSSQV